MQRLIRNLLMFVTAVGTAFFVALFVGKEFGKSGLPFAFLAGLAAGYAVIRLFRLGGALDG